jgi:putative peptidoglycan lipid II flippase
LKTIRPAQSLLKFTSLLMAGALAGKLLGFLREILFARQLGAGSVADSFRGSTTAVLLPVSPFVGDMTQGALVPLYREWNKEGIAAKMFTSLALVLTLIACVIMGAVLVFCELYVDWMVAGFSAEAKDMTVHFTRIMAMAIPSFVLFNILACIELGVGRVRMAVIRASVQNVAVIVGIVVMVFLGSPVAIAWGFLISMNLTTVYGLGMLWREGEITPREVSLESVYVASAMYFKRVRSLFAQPLLEQFNILVEKFLASMLVVGTVASMDYARTLTDTAVYFIGQPIGLAVLSREAAADPKARVKMICKPLLHIGLPVSAFTLIFATDLTTLVFRRGQFQGEAIRLTSSAMQGISIGIWAAVLGWILVRMLNAAHRNNDVAKVFMFAYACNTCVNLATYKFWGIFGIGLGEAVRGIMLLAGASYMLGCFRVMLGLVATALPLTAIVTLVGLGVCDIYSNPLARLALGAGLFTLFVTLDMAVTFPELTKEVLNRLRKITTRILPAVL